MLNNKSVCIFKLYGLDALFTRLKLRIENKIIIYKNKSLLNIYIIFFLP